MGIISGVEFIGTVRWGKHNPPKDRHAMPLKALLDGQPILAPLLGDTAWAALYFQRYRLVLPCCPDRAVQMRGGAGTTRIQHFSHAPAPTCQFRAETMAHLRAKVAIARACAEAGWSVDIEHAEDDWRADILADRGSQRVAFEVQWSRQTLAETAARQARYRAAGVRGCWFFRYPPHEVRRPGGDTTLEARQDLPLFGLTTDRTRDGYRVQVGGHAHPLGQVVGALLGGRIAFRSHRTALGQHVVDIAFHDKVCPSCGAPCRVYRVAARADAVPRAMCGARVLLWSGVTHHPDVAHTVRRLYEASPRPDAIPLALIEPAAGFRCPTCKTRLMPPPLTDPAAHDSGIAADVTFARPLCDPYPHWCYPPDGPFCVPIAPDDGS